MTLPAEDREYLDAHYPKRWDIVKEGPGKNVLVIRDFVLPEEFDSPTSTLMILVPSGYPGSNLDMFYFNPPIERIDRAVIGGLAQEEHIGKTWQRWSRHYEWQPGFDSLVRHIEFVKTQLVDPV